MRVEAALRSTNYINFGLVSPTQFVVISFSGYSASNNRMLVCVVMMIIVEN